MKEKKPVQRKEETCTSGDEWYNACGSFHSQDENCLEEMVMSIPTCSSKVPKIPGLPKIVNLIDFDECNAPPQSWQEPKLVGACYTPENPKFSTPGNSEALEKENQILLKRLACAGELKSIEPSFVQDEVKDKRQMIDELIIKGREVEAKLSKLTTMTFPASELARQVKVLQDLRAQLDKRTTLLDHHESKVQWCEDSCPASEGGRRKTGCLRFKPPRIRESFSSVFQSIFSKRSHEFDM